MEEKTLQNYLKAGKIASEALQYGKSLIKPGTKVKEVLIKVEEKIKQLGSIPAFPAQISLNEFAAHSCSDSNDETILKDQVIKLDVGVHIEGCIADTALSVDLSGKYANLIKASQEALEEALKLAVPGTSLGEIGRIIHKVITSYGFSPVKNLSGHGLGEYNIHDKPSVPNYDNGNKNVLVEGQIIAIEPFASTGSGMVQESSPATVFTLVNDSGVRDPISRNVLKEIKTYKGLPFAKRWLEEKFGTAKTNFAIKQLTHLECLQHHPPLFDTNRGIVSQAEHSVIVGKKPIVFTRD